MRIGMMSFAHHHAEAYIGNLRAIPDVEVIGFADEIAQRAAIIASQFGLQRFQDYRAMLR